MLSVIPLGGYVKLIGDDPRGADGDHPRAFLNKPISHRIAVVAAGPLANFALAVAIFAGVHWVGVPTPQISELPEVGEVVADSPAQQAGLQPGDRILMVNGTAGRASGRIWCRLSTGISIPRCSSGCSAGAEPST